MNRLLILTAIAVAAVAAPLSSTAGATPGGSINGHFPIDEHFVIEPDSTTCGFPITLDITGEGVFNLRLDADGNPLTLRVSERTVGTTSANGIALKDFSSDTKFIDFRTSAEREVGLVFRDNFVHGGTVIMDRGRLVWNLDPETGESIGDPVWEAGPHPELHGDIAAFCAAFTA